ncbi:MAG: transglutaminase-like cysteine peptidase [Campylobacterota bacterium]|nr:transglutaminase-like cysteine peptidase [Campylobacterota bacterium]
MKKRGYSRIGAVVILGVYINMLIVPLKSLTAQEFLVSKKTLQQVRKKYGSDASMRVENMNRLLHSVQQESVEKQLRSVNDFFNKVPFSTDQQKWGKEDYWATPLEFLGVNEGDCEDYVIAKFFALLKLGIAQEKLYFTYVTYLPANQAHMVLTYVEKPNSIPLVLDNINKKTLLASQRHDLKHVYSFNAEALYLNKQKSLGQIVPSGLKKNRRWVEFLSRVTMEQL